MVGSACGAPSVDGRAGTDTGGTTGRGSGDVRELLDDPPWHHERLSFAPSAPPSHDLGGPGAKVEYNLAERKLIGALEVDGGEGTPRMTRLARALAWHLPERGPIPPRMVGAAQDWAAHAGPPPRVVGIVLPGVDCREKPATEACARAIQDLRTRAGVRKGELVGVGAVLMDGRSRVVVAVGESAVELDPARRSLPLGKKVLLRGRLSEGLRAPRIVAISPVHGAHDVDTEYLGNRRFRAGYVCEAPGVHRLEILAEGREGPRVAADLPVYCGVGAHDPVQVDHEWIDASIDPSEVAWASLAHLNRARQAHGLRPLAWSPEAAGVAVAHSEDMAAQARIAHRIHGRDVGVRLRARRIEHALARENVALGYGPLTIHQALMDSAGHRANMLAEDVTHVGIGVTYGPPEGEGWRPVYLTQVMYRPGEAGS